MLGLKRCMILALGSLAILLTIGVTSASATSGEDGNEIESNLAEMAAGEKLRELEEIMLRYDLTPLQALKHSHRLDEYVVEQKRAPFSSWGGKRSRSNGKAFSAWGGKRNSIEDRPRRNDGLHNEALKVIRPARAAFSAWGGR